MYKIGGIKPGDLANGDIAVIRPGDLANGDIAVIRPGDIANGDISDGGEFGYFIGPDYEDK